MKNGIIAICCAGFLIQAPSLLFGKQPVDVSLVDSMYYYLGDTATDSWKKNHKDLYAYDADGNLTEDLYYGWEGFTNSWRLTEKWEYINTNKLKIEATRYFRISNAWRPQDQETYTYDGNGKTTEYIESQWDNTVSALVNEKKETYEYDANGNLTVTLIHSWNASLSAWKTGSKIVFTYDTNGLPTERVFSTWDSNDSTWNNGSRYTYAYDGNGNLSESILYIWITGWDYPIRYTYTYDGSGNLLEMLTYSWESNMWVAYTKKEHTYDSGNLTQYIIFKWDTLTSSWKNWHKYESLYDVLDNQTEYSNYTWSESRSAWDKDIRHFFYRSLHQVTSVSTVKPDDTNNNIMLRPNPAVNELSITGIPDEGIAQIFNVEGKHVKTAFLGKEHNMLDISTLPEGNYLMRIKTGKESITRLFIKE